MVIGGGEPMLPDSHATSTVTVDVPVGSPRYSTCRFHYRWLAARKIIGEDDTNFELTERARWVGAGSRLIKQICPFDADRLDVICRPQFRLIEADCGFHFGKTDPVAVF